MTAMLEELIERGEIVGALFLKGSWTLREREIARDAWQQGIKMGREFERKSREAAK